MAGLTAPAPRGACPDLLSPMASGDGLLLRLKPPVGGLTPAQLAAVACGCRRGGNGSVEITSRGNLQLRGFTAATADAFADEMIRLGLAVADPAAERVRNVLVAPLAGDDPSAASEAEAIARALEAALCRSAQWQALPAKFGFSVDAGGRLPLGRTTADITLMPAGDSWLIAGDGTTGAAQVRGADAADAALRLAGACLALWRDRGETGGRLRHLADHDEATLWAAAGLDPVSRAAEATPIDLIVGPLLYRNGTGTFAFAAPFGATGAGTLEALSDLMLRVGARSLTIGPWRSLHLRGVPDAALPDIAEAAVALDLIAAPDDPRLRVTACAGAPACASGSVPARRDAARIARFLAPGTTRVHVSGCAKGCANPAATDVVLVGDAGRYALVRAGRAGDTPLETGLDVDAAMQRLETRPLN